MRPDAGLIGRVAQGDRGAFTELVDAHAAAVLRFARAAAHDPSLADDAVQETFLAAWRGAKGFRGASERAWLLGIARNAVRRQFRRHVGEPASFDPIDDLGEAAGWGDDPERCAIAAEDGEALRRALDALGPDDREILVLVELEGLTGEQAADVLEVGLAAMKSRLHRARLRLAARLRQEVSHAG